MYILAANCFQQSKNFDQAVKCFESAISCEENEVDAREQYRQAAICIQDHNQTLYIKFMRKAIELYCLSGRTNFGADFAHECAKKLEKDKNENSIEFFTQAYKLFGQNNKSE